MKKGILKEALCSIEIAKFSEGPVFVSNNNNNKNNK